MPFSIRRLTHLNRSQSLQTRKDGSSKNHSLPENVPESCGSPVDNESVPSKSSKATPKVSKTKSKPLKSGNNKVGGSGRFDSNLAHPLTSITSQQTEQSASYQAPLHVPPSFVIRNQTTIHGSAFQPASVSQVGPSKFEPVLPNSRSLDSNEIRRLTAANQSSKSVCL